MCNNWNAVVIINGSGGCGKSEFVKQCRETKILPVYEFSSVDYVKEVARYCGWNGEKTDRDRAFLHDLKMALEKWKDIPTIDVISKIEAQMDGKTDNLFFVNIREIHNIVRFKQIVKETLKLPCYDMLVINDNVPVITSNSADAQVRIHSYDYYIHNNGTLDELKDKAKEFVENIYPYAKEVEGV